MMRGSCKWWNSTRGYGFVTGEDGRDYFLHYSEIEGTGRKDVSPNDYVDFEPAENAKGLKATKVKVATINRNEGMNESQKVDTSNV